MSQQTYNFLPSLLKQVHPGQNHAQVNVPVSAKKKKKKKCKARNYAEENIKNDSEENSKIYKIRQKLTSVMLVAAKVTTAFYWNARESPTISQWLNELWEYFYHGSKYF